MKIRILDVANDGVRKNPDQIWLLYANKLLEAFGDITWRNKVLPDDFRELYVTQRVRPLDEKILSSLIFSVPPAFVDPAILFPVSAAVKESNSAIKSHWASSEAAPFLLLGYIGTGKSTYLEHFFLDEVKEINNNIEGIIVDFKVAPTTPEAFTSFVLQEIDNQILQLDPRLESKQPATIQMLFKKELDLVDALFEDPESKLREKELIFSSKVMRAIQGHVPERTELTKRKLDFLRSHGKEIWLALDNIDQHFFMLHAKAFVDAIALAHSLGCRLIICMRYLSLDTHAMRQVYDSYRPRKLKLSFPDVREMLRKRLAFFKSQNRHFMEEASQWTGGHIRVKDLATDLEKAVELLCDPQFLKSFLLPLSNYNLRRLLEILLSCFQSYYFFFDRFNNERYLPTAKTLKKRFLYAHLLKNADYYYPFPKDAQERCIINLFDNETKGSDGSNFIRLRILQYLMGAERSVTLKQLTSDILEVFNFNSDDMASALQAFIANELVALKNVNGSNFDTAILHNPIASSHLSSDGIEITISRCGRVHFELAHQLAYVEIMKMSTHVDEREYMAIQGEESQRAVSSRHRSTMLFLDYLWKVERQEVQFAIKNKELFEKRFGVLVPGIIRSVREQYAGLLSSMDSR